MNPDGLKISSDNECPIDVFNIKACRKFYPQWRKAGVTPNGLTYMSIIFGLIACAATWYKYYTFAGVAFFIGYMFDCCDGNYARTFGLETAYGDLLDHGSDFIVYMLLIWILYKQGHYRTVLVFILAILSVKPQMTFQECLYGESTGTGSTLSAYHKIVAYLGLTKETCAKWIQYTKFFGTGTANLIIALGLVYIGINENNK